MTISDKWVLPIIYPGGYVSLFRSLQAWSGKFDFEGCISNLLLEPAHKNKVPYRHLGLILLSPGFSWALVGQNICPLTLWPPQFHMQAQKRTNATSRDQFRSPNQWNRNTLDLHVEWYHTSRGIAMCLNYLLRILIALIYHTLLDIYA